MAKKYGGRLRRLTKQQMLEVINETVKIYFDYNISVEESIEKVKGMILDEKVEKVEKAN